MNTHAPIAREDITGLILAGGRGSRMGGVDKGLQLLRGMPLAMHAILRLQPQVGPLMVNANRHIGAYESLGVPVWPDSLADYPGPLAGFLAGLEHCETAWLATVPCDSPHFPHDLVARLAAGLQAEGADIALAATIEEGRLQPQPVFSLIAAPLVEDLVVFLNAGERKIDRWMARHRMATVVFDEVEAFANANTLEELRRLA